MQDFAEGDIQSENGRLLADMVRRLSEQFPDELPKSYKVLQVQEKKIVEFHMLLTLKLGELWQPLSLMVKAVEFQVVFFLLNNDTCC